MWFRVMIKTGLNWKYKFCDVKFLLQEHYHIKGIINQV